MARDKVIVFNGADGKCRVVIPTVDCTLSDDAIISKDISASEYSVIDASELPNTAFRSAWKYYHGSKNVIAELADAKTITTEILETRYLSIKKENVDIQSIADMKGESASLKSNPAVPYSTITNATAVSQLEALI